MHDTILYLYVLRVLLVLLTLLIEMQFLCITHGFQMIIRIV